MNEQELPEELLEETDPNPAPVKISSEQQASINALGNHLVGEYFANLHPSDRGKKTNPVEVLVRSAIKHVIEIIGPSATPESVAAGLYDVLHIGDNITYLMKQMGDAKLGAIATGLKKRHRH